MIPTRVVQLVGGVLCLIGVAGLFMRISQDDGALAITGAILFSAGLLTQRSGFWK